jgi:nitric oxide reductase NorD protein
MEIDRLKERFYQTVYPSRPNEWEVDEVFEKLAQLQATSRQLLLDHVPAIWPISHSLCFTCLAEAGRSAELIPEELFPEWIRQILAIYERRGLSGVRRFISDVEGNFLEPLRGVSRVNYADIVSTMTHYVRGVGGKPFVLQSAANAGTDTENIYLPSAIDVFPVRRDNELLYKLIISLQWAQSRSRLFGDVVDLAADSSVDSVAERAAGSYRDLLFAAYPEKALAEDILSVVQFIKNYYFLADQLPGLVRQTSGICRKILEEISAQGKNSQRAAAFYTVIGEVFGLSSVTAPGHFFSDGKGWKKSILGRPALESLALLYPHIALLGGEYSLANAQLLFGSFDFDATAKKIVEMRHSRRDSFMAMLAKFTSELAADEGLSSEEGAFQQQIFDALSLVASQADNNQQLNGEKQQLLFDNNDWQIPEELLALAAEIVDDLGEIPTAYVQAASGSSSAGFHQTAEVSTAQQEEVVSPVAGTVYDEWDYRRGGYRKDWCTLYEKSVSPVTSSFVADTLRKYRSQLIRMRRQFEMLRNSDRFARRRRHGDDIDLDALIESLGDRCAGLSPSDRLFIRLLHDDRDMSALFLVDMSSSTEGWVGVAIKEALVLLAEALEVVGDPYGIFGFSGMRRSKSEIYHIKEFEEGYSRDVKRRIAAMKPMEYTRMGPPIRHLTARFEKIESRVKLLIVLCDGKPEDYDDYKGQYAIEDTRKALLEARGRGVYPFCITIDRSAQDYLPHLFGRGNYIFVKDVVSLPGRLAEMYRLLTS